MTGDDFSFDFPEVGAGRYRLQVQRESAIEAVSSPIWVEPPGYAAPARRVPAAGRRWSPPTAPATAPNRQHGPPLAFGSCARPAAESHGADRRHARTRTARPAGRWRAHAWRAAGRPRAPRPTRPTWTVAVTAERRARAGDARGPHRRADRPRSPCGSPTAAARRLPGGGNEPATVTDLPLDVPVQCAATGRRRGRGRARRRPPSTR